MYLQGDDAVILAEVPLNNMFGYSTVIRSNTQVRSSMCYGHATSAAVALMHTQLQLTTVNQCTALAFSSISTADQRDATLGSLLGTP
jgi:translation elongation factor EF-G